MDHTPDAWNRGRPTAKPAIPEYDSDDSDDGHYDLAWQVAVAIAGVLTFACIIGCIVWVLITFCADRRKTRTATTAPAPQQPKRQRVAETRPKKGKSRQEPVPPKPVEPARPPNDSPFLTLMSPPTPMPKSPKLASGSKPWNYAQQPSQQSSTAAAASTLSENALERTCTEYNTLE